MTDENETARTEITTEITDAAAAFESTTPEVLVEAAIETAEPVVEAIATPVDQVIDVATARQQEAIEAVEAVSATVIENVTLAQRAIAEFVSTRIRADIETQQQLLRCKSFDEVRSIQSTFLKTAVEQYRDNAQRLFKLGQEIVSKSTHRSN